MLQTLLRDCPSNEGKGGGQYAHIRDCMLYYSQHNKAYIKNYKQNKAYIKVLYTVRISDPKHIVEVRVEDVRPGP